MLNIEMSFFEWDHQEILFCFTGVKEILIEGIDLLSQLREAWEKIKREVTMKRGKISMVVVLRSTTPSACHRNFWSWLQVSVTDFLSRVKSFKICDNRMAVPYLSRIMLWKKIKEPFKRLYFAYSTYTSLLPRTNADSLGVIRST